MGFLLSASYSSARDATPGTGAISGFPSPCGVGRYDRVRQTLRASGRLTGLVLCGRQR
jgi:hypothetical protein